MTSFQSLQSRLHELILSDRLYVDKTHEFSDFIRHLEGSQQEDPAPVSLVIRPRGYTLSVATEIIEALLERDDLMMDMLERHEIHEELPEHPVIRISFKKVQSRSAQEFSDALIDLIQEQLWEHHVVAKITTYDDPKSYFLSLIRSIAQRRKGKVAVIIDNYDIPFFIARTLKPEEQDRAVAIYLDTLNAIRQAGDDVAWCLLTGHVKFALASEMSEGLPLVKDLSFSPICDTLFGFTREELSRNFAKAIDRYAPRHGITNDEFTAALEKCYGGHVFSDRMHKMFCPGSINSVFANEGNLFSYIADEDFRFLTTVLREGHPELDWLIGKAGQDALFAREVTIRPRNEDDFGALLVQLGFLTIEKVTRSDNEQYSTWHYSYKVPNVEYLRTLKIILGVAAPGLAKIPINPTVCATGEHDFDLKIPNDIYSKLLDEHCVF